MSACRVCKATFALALMAASRLWALEVPFFAGRVNDEANLLSDAEEQRLESVLASLEQATGAQVAVLTIPSLEGESLEEFSHRVASTWQLGQKGKDNGVLFLIAQQDRKMRLEVGYGLESVLTDARCRQILDNLVRPRFREGDYAGGITAGVQAIEKVLQGSAIPEGRGTGAGRKRPGVAATIALLSVFLVVVGTFSLAALASTGCQSWFFYLFLLPFWIAFPMVIHPWVGLVTGVAWLVLFPLLKALLAGSPWGRQFRQSHANLFTTFASTSRSRGSWGSGGFFGGGSFGGGFSGGGGSFGGGGASSSW